MPKGVVILKYDENIIIFIIVFIHLHAQETYRNPLKWSRYAVVMMVIMVRVIFVAVA